MQEMVSPFRNKFKLESSPEESPAKQSDGEWMINPERIPRTKQFEPESVMAADPIHEESEQYISSKYNSTQQSECISPVKNPAFFKHTEVQVVSPGKLKEFLREQQAEVLFQIRCTEQQILENSPSKTSFVEESLMDLLRQKRMQRQQMA